MCFSATASFAAAGVLAGSGILTLRKAMPARRMIAGVPALFAAQQFAEGCVWLAVGNLGYEHWVPFFSYTFLFFAFVVWPIWIPAALCYAERVRTLKSSLRFFTAWGAAVATYGLYMLFTHPISARILDFHIKYDLGRFDTSAGALHLLLYTVAIAAPFFVSSLRYTKLFGTTLLGLLAFTYWFLPAVLTSVWCFFAAVLSVLTFLIVVWG